MTRSPDPALIPESAPAIPVWTLVRRLLALAWEHRLVALPAIAATVAFQALTLAGLWGQGLAIDVIRASVDPAAPAPRWPPAMEPPESWSLILRTGLVVAMVLALSALAGTARFFTRYTDELFVQACVVDLRRRLYAKLQQLPFAFFDKMDTGQIINRVAGDSQQVRMFIQGVVIRAGIAIVTLGIFLWFMAGQHLWLTLACLSVFPFQVLVMVRVGRITKPKYLEQSRLGDLVVNAFSESIAGVRVIRVFGRHREAAARFRDRAQSAFDQRMTLAWDQVIHTPFIQASNIFAHTVLLGYGGWLVLRGVPDGGIALGTFWVFRGLLERLAAQAEAISSIIAEAPESLAGAERVFALLDRPVEIADRPGAKMPEPDAAADESGAGVEFRNVTFGYSPDRPVLHDISLKVAPGETIAIVGPTGCGKSTLLSLVSRFHDPQAGAVLVSGVDVRDLPLAELRRSLGVVFQEPFLFSTTIEANVAFGSPHAPRDDVRRAAEAAAAEEFIAALPAGLDTVVGERGVSLSGGERQRLTIARAMLVRPSILLLDDATGSVDALTESEIHKSLDEFMRGRTTFIVAHRLSTLRRADRVVVLDRGRIVDVGTHDELMNRPGHYRAAALIQLALDEDERGAEPASGAAS